ncbi:hypothetical protein [Rhizobium vallis]|uniref:hypothetical protein n=1 Tax=Rhizobium vallis TaxID=634290 RepID=UPI001FDFD048|nr:hypothetical protein [Rhizobium vallis]
MKRYRIRLTDEAELDLARIYLSSARNPHLLPSPATMWPASRRLWMGSRHIPSAAASVIMFGLGCASSVLSAG